jgi:hypothetical protein
VEAYALAAVLGTWLASLVAAFFAGRATVDDALARERERAERAEELARSRKADLVASAQRATRTVAAIQGLLNRKAGRDDAVNGAAGVAPSDLSRVLDGLLWPDGGGEGREAEAGEAGSPGEAGLAGAGEGVGSGGGLG